jgi:hypothetical protein
MAYHMPKRTRYFIGSSEFDNKADAVAKARQYANKDGHSVKVTIETSEAHGFERPLRQSSFMVEPSRRKNPPSGWIPATAVKITRKNGRMVVRIRKVAGRKAANPRKRVNPSGSSTVLIGQYKNQSGWHPARVFDSAREAADWRSRVFEAGGHEHARRTLRVRRYSNAHEAALAADR